MSTNRELLTIEELSKRLTAQLQKIKGCEVSTISVQYRMPELGSDGCNWIESAVSMQVEPPATKDILRQHVLRLVREARAKYNVKD